METPFIESRPPPGRSHGKGSPRTRQVKRKQVLRWRRGTEPLAGAYHALVKLARWIPGGIEILMGEDFLAPSAED